jgi:hypothetical protein
LEFLFFILNILPVEAFLPQFQNQLFLCFCTLLSKIIYFEVLYPDERFFESEYKLKLLKFTWLFLQFSSKKIFFLLKILKFILQYKSLILKLFRFYSRRLHKAWLNLDGLVTSWCEVLPSILLSLKVSLIFF